MAGVGGQGGDEPLRLVTVPTGGGGSSLASHRRFCEAFLRMHIREEASAHRAFKYADRNGTEKEKRVAFDNLFGAFENLSDLCNNRTRTERRVGCIQLSLWPYIERWQHRWR